MGNNPLYEVSRDQFEAVFMLGAADDVNFVENVDVQVTMKDGTRWSATFMSMREIQRVMDRWSVSGECAGDSYFQCPDLVIIRDPGVPAMVRVLEDALAEGDPRSILVPLA